MADKPVRADKATAVAELTDSFRNSAATVLTEYRGLTVSQITELRRSLGAQTKYSVSKNTLAKRAATATGAAAFTSKTSSNCLMNSDSSISVMSLNASSSSSVLSFAMSGNLSLFPLV